MDQEKEREPEIAAEEGEEEKAQGMLGDGQQTGGDEHGGGQREDSGEDDAQPEEGSDRTDDIHTDDSDDVQQEEAGNRTYDSVELEDLQPEEGSDRTDDIHTDDSGDVQQEEAGNRTYDSVELEDLQPEEGSDRSDSVHVDDKDGGMQQESGNVEGVLLEEGGDDRTDSAYIDDIDNDEGAQEEEVGSGSDDSVQLEDEQAEHGEKGVRKDILIYFEDDEDSDLQEVDTNDDIMIYFEDGGEEQKQEQIIHKLAELPIMVCAVEELLDRYKQVKGCNALFGTCLELAQFAGHLAAVFAGPYVSRRFRSQIDKFNHYSCACVDKLDLLYPGLWGPPSEVIKDGQEFLRDAWVHVEPITRPVTSTGCGKLVWTVGKTTFNAGKRAFQVGRTCAWLTFLPAIVCCKVGVYMTGAALRTGLQVADMVGQHLTEQDQEDEVNQLQGQVTLEMIEDLIYMVLSGFPDSGGERGREGRLLAEQVRSVALKIYSSKEKDVEMSLKLLMCLFLGWIVYLITASVTLLQLSGKCCQALVNTIGCVWNWCISLIPHLVPHRLHPPKDPLKKAGLLLKTLIQGVGELMTSAHGYAALGLKGLGRGCVNFLKWCQHYYCSFDKSAGGMPTRCILFLGDSLVYIMELMEALSQTLVDALFHNASD